MMVHFEKTDISLSWDYQLLSLQQKGRRRGKKWKEKERTSNSAHLVLCTKTSSYEQEYFANLAKLEEHIIKTI